MDLTVVCITSVVVLAGIAAAYDIARRHLLGLRRQEVERLETLLEVETGARDDDVAMLIARLTALEKRPQPESAVQERVEIHEAALKNALQQIRGQFQELDARWAELERKLKSDVSGSIAAATDGFSTNWRQV